VIAGSTHPSKLRVLVTYKDSNCDPRVGVPPESLWITWQTISGNAVINDAGFQTNADDSTNVDGQTRFTFPSVSGCGKIRLHLYVSFDDDGTRNVTIRTVDTNADLERRITTADETSACDLNYNGTAGDTTDVRLVQNHRDHWRRNALHGTLVRRTNLCETGCGDPPINSIGEGQVFWSPNGRWLSYTVETAPNGKCNVFIVPSDPTIGSRPKAFMFLPDTADYDPSWSPLGDQIVFGRADYEILRKGIPGLAADTSEIRVTSSGAPDTKGDLTPAISPDGQTVAFGRRQVGGTYDGAYHIFSVPIGGGTATQLTSATTTVNDQYPQWSPDGQWITFDREIVYPAEHRIFKVKANGDSLQQVYFAGATFNAATPGFSPDGLIITAGIGHQSTFIADTQTNTLDPLLPTRQPIINYCRRQVRDRRHPPGPVAAHVP